MPQVCHKHCPPGRGGTAAAVLAVLAVIIAATLARPVVHAAEAALEVAAITAGAVLGVAVAAGAVALAVTARRRAAPRVYPLTARTAQRLSAPRMPAIEPAAVRWEDDAAGVTRQADQYRS